VCNVRDFETVFDDQFRKVFNMVDAKQDAVPVSI